MTAGTLITILAAGWSIALLLAAWWAWGSVRSWWFSRGGKRAGTRYCRACNFDLTGLTRDDTTPAKRCPECGAEIDREGAVVVGKAITRRPKLEWAALAVALATALVFATLTVSRPPVPWLHLMPDWVLVRMAKGGTAADADNALRELSKRWGFVSWMPTPWRVASIIGLNYPADALPMGGKQPPNLAAVAELAREALERQSDRSRPWVPVWGQVIESAIALNLLDEQQQARYQDNWIVLSIQVQRRTRRGTNTPMMFEVTDMRTPRKVNLFIADQGVVPRPATSEYRQTSTSFGVVSGARSFRQIEGTERLPVGVHRIEIEADVDIGDGAVGRDTAAARRWSATIEVVEPDQPLSQIVSDPAVDREMKGAVPDLRIDLSLAPGSESRRMSASDNPMVRVRLWCRVDRPPPLDLAAFVVVLDVDRPDARSAQLEPILIERATKHWVSFTTMMALSELPAGLRGKSARLRLIGHSLVADTSPIVGSYWGGTIEYAGVPVSSQGVPGVDDRWWPEQSK